jgi:hypothetical protein
MSLISKKRGRSDSQQPAAATTKKQKSEGVPFSRINVLDEQRAFIGV